MSFLDSVNEEREKLRKGNQSNLAQAFLYLEEAEADIAERLVKIAELKAEIEAAGEEKTIVEQSSAVKIKKIYERARKLHYNLADY